MAPEILHKMLFAIFSLFIARADMKTGTVPRIAFVFALPFFFVWKTLFLGREHLWGSALGMLTGLIVFMLVFILLKSKLGLADVWHSALIGMVHGFWWWYIAIGAACFMGMLYIIASKKRRIPFIPFMAAGSIFASMVYCFR